MDGLGVEWTSEPKALLGLVGAIQHSSVGSMGERQD